MPCRVLKRKADHSGQRRGKCQRNESMVIVVSRAKSAEVMPAGRRVVRISDVMVARERRVVRIR